MRLIFVYIVCALFFVGCKKDSPKAPEAATLVAPAKNSECTPLQSDNGTSSVVRFNWLASDHTETYELQVTNLETGTGHNKITSNTVETLSLSKGAAFSWVVISSNSKTNKTASSGSWFFYNPGTETSYVPFPAEILNPEPGVTVFRDINNEVTLNWSGADLDDDVVKYDVYFSTENPPEELLASVNGNIEARSVSVEHDTVYYWRVVTTDSEGNTSDSGIVDFRCH